MNRLERTPDTSRVCDWSDDDFEREERRVKRFHNAIEHACEFLTERNAT